MASISGKMVFDLEKYLADNRADVNAHGRLRSALNEAKMWLYLGIFEVVSSFILATELNIIQIVK